MIERREHRWAAAAPQDAFEDASTSSRAWSPGGIAFGSDCGTLGIGNEWGESSLPVGHGAWLEGHANLRGNGDEPVAAWGAWTGEGTFEVRLCSLEDVYCPVFLVHYTDGDLRLNVEPNASWGPATVTTVTGQASLDA